MHPTRNNEPPLFHPKINPSNSHPLYCVNYDTHNTFIDPRCSLDVKIPPHTHFHFLILQKEIDVYYTFELFMCLLVGFIFETRSRVAYAFIEPTMEPRMTFYFRSSCFSIPCAGITSVSLASVSRSIGCLPRVWCMLGHRSTDWDESLSRINGFQHYACLSLNWIL